MRNGVLIETIMEQIRAEIAWTLLIQRKLQPSVVVSDEEVDEALADLQANLGKPEYRVAEIYLATDAASGEDQVRQTAQRLADQLRQGADFESLARQFSQSATAARGGDLGWVRPGQLDGDLEAAVRDLQPGQVAGPLRSTGGYNILQLLDRRQTGGASVLDAMVSLRQVFIPLAQSAPATEVDAAETLARSVIAQARSCDDMTRIARETNPQANADLGELRIGELPDVLRPIATDLELNRPSQPIRVESGIGVFMVCKREQPEAGLPTRQDIAQSIRNERIDVLARGYLRDLRRAAFVDVRV
jgi:peptidyl-prolyl cis-trans isomerase SurA